MWQHGNRVRLTGWCRIEFEDTALYETRDAWKNRNSVAIWLKVGWPVSKELLALNGRRVSVEGRFDADAHGHMGGFAGTIEDIHEIAPADARQSQ